MQFTLPIEFRIISLEIHIFSERDLKFFQEFFKSSWWTGIINSVLHLCYGKEVQ